MCARVIACCIEQWCIRSEAKHIHCFQPTSHNQFIALEHNQDLWQPASVRVNTFVQLVHALLGTMRGPVHPVLKHGPRSLAFLRAHG